MAPEFSDSRTSRCPDARYGTPHTISAAITRLALRRILCILMPSCETRQVTLVLYKSNLPAKHRKKQGSGANRMNRMRKNGGQCRTRTCDLLLVRRTSQDWTKCRPPK